MQVDGKHMKLPFFVGAGHGSGVPCESLLSSSGVVPKQESRRNRRRACDRREDLSTVNVAVGFQPTPPERLNKR
jgi:hypothetical protein